MGALDTLPAGAFFVLWCRAHDGRGAACFVMRARTRGFDPYIRGKVKTKFELGLGVVVLWGWSAWPIVTVVGTGASRRKTWHARMFKIKGSHPHS